MSNKTPKFKEAFSEPQYFSDDRVYIDGSYSKEEACKLISEEVGIDIEPGSLEEDRVRFGFPPDTVEDYVELGACWYSGAKGKGSMKVWKCEA